MPDNILEIVFSTKQQKIVANVLISTMKKKGGEINKNEMSEIATTLHEGKLQTQIDEQGYRGRMVKLSYNKRQFYDRILTPLMGMGMIDYNIYKKTYRISNDFCKQMEKIGSKWTEYLDEPKKKKMQ